MEYFIFTNSATMGKQTQLWTRPRARQPTFWTGETFQTNFFLEGKNTKSVFDTKHLHSSVGFKTMQSHLSRKKRDDGWWVTKLLL